MKNQLYFIALIPPSPMKEEIQQYKLEIKNNFGSKHSLNAPPHITLLSPFRSDDENKDKLGSLLRNLTKNVIPFKVSFDNFSTFPSKVVFIDVLKSPKLIELQNSLEDLARSKPNLFNYNYDERPYHPHLTLAFKDLDKNTFYDIWDEFKDQEFEESFEANQLYLLRHDGEGWIIANDFPFDASD